MGWLGNGGGCAPPAPAARTAPQSAAAAHRRPALPAHPRAQCQYFTAAAQSQCEGTLGAALGYSRYPGGRRFRIGVVSAAKHAPQRRLFVADAVAEEAPGLRVNVRAVCESLRGALRAQQGWERALQGCSWLSRGWDTPRSLFASPPTHHCGKRGRAQRVCKQQLRADGPDEPAEVARVPDEPGGVLYTL